MSSSDEYVFPVLEALETRLLLDGNVAISGTSSTLILQGDSASNAIQIRRARDTNAVLVSGRADSSTGRPTTVNGEAFVSVSSAIRSVKVLLGSGNDEVSFGDFALIDADEDVYTGNVLVDLGPGTAGQRVLFGQGLDGSNTMMVRISGKLDITGGATADTVLLKGVTVGKGVGLKLGGGANVVRMEASSFLGRGNVAKSLNIVTGAGSDDIRIDDTTVTGKTTIQTGSDDLHDIVAMGSLHGPVQFGSLSITCLGTARVRLGGMGTMQPSLVLKNLTIDTGRGNDGVFLQAVRVSGSTRIRTWGGDDEVTLYGNQAFTCEFARKVSVDTGAGNDILWAGEDGQAFREGNGMGHSNFTIFKAAVTFLLGDGNDQCVLGDIAASADDDNGDGNPDTGEAGCDFRGKLTLNGGNGTDVGLNYAGNHYAKEPKGIGFP